MWVWVYVGVCEREREMEHELMSNEPWGLLAKCIIKSGECWNVFEWKTKVVL